jgi:hypothetical protein
MDSQGGAAAVATQQMGAMTRGGGCARLSAAVRGILGGQSRSPESLVVDP